MFTIIVKSQTNNNSFVLHNNDIKFELGFEFKQLYQRPTYNINPLIDPEIEKNRPIDTSDYYSPFMHSALYFGINYEINYKEKYKLKFTSFFEQRNWSLGPYSKYFYNYYPQYKFSIADTIKFNDKYIPIKVKIGDMYVLNEIQTGLKAYNIDFQGSDIEAKYKRLKLNVLYISSLDFHVGLRIDEFIRTKLQYDYNLKNNAALLSTALSYEYNKMAFIQNSMGNIGFIASLNFAKDYRYYLIAEYKLSNSFFNEVKSSNVAFVLAMDYNVSKKKYKLGIKSKLRYYGYEFRELDYNKSYYLYRNSNPLFDAFNHFYPLRNYYRPVSQYSMYAEYYDDYGLYSLELNIGWDWQFSNKIGHKLDVELLQFYRNSSFNGNHYTNIYFTSFLYFKFAKSFKGGLYISNKQMNRDVQYQAFYQMQYPFFGFQISYDGKFELGK